MTPALVSLAKQDPIWILTMSRPPENRLSIPLMDELTARLGEAAGAAGCRVVVLQAEGELFCGGGELGDYRVKAEAEIRAFGGSFLRLHSAVTRIEKPVVAAVEGPALGGGFSLVEACDLAVASAEAIFGVPEITTGLAPMMALTGVVRVASRKRAMELALLGEPLDAMAACQLGLVNWVVPRPEVRLQALAAAGRLAQANPAALALCKRLYRRDDGLTYQAQLTAGLEELVALLAAPSAAEALTAREAGRPPRWDGHVQDSGEVGGDRS